MPAEAAKETALTVQHLRVHVGGGLGNSEDSDIAGVQEGLQP